MFSQRAEVTMKDFSSFLDMRRYKAGLIKSSSENVCLKPCHASFSRSTGDSFTLSTLSSSRGAERQQVQQLFNPAEAEGKCSCSGPLRERGPWHYTGARWRCPRSSSLYFGATLTVSIFPTRSHVPP